MGVERGEGPRGVGAQTQKKRGGPKRVGPKGCLPEAWGPKEVGGPNKEKVGGPKGVATIFAFCFLSL